MEPNDCIVGRENKLETDYAAGAGYSKAISCFQVGKWAAGLVAVTPETSVEALAQFETGNRLGRLTAKAEQVSKSALVAGLIHRYTVVDPRAARRLRSLTEF